VVVTTAAGTGKLAAGFKVKEPSPTVASILPGEGTPGQSLTVEVIGTRFHDVRAVSFGSGIAVDNFTVVSDSQLEANITIDTSAGAGVRNVSVTTAAGTGTWSSDFIVGQQAAEEGRSRTWIWIVVGVAGAALLAGGAAAFVAIRKRSAKEMARPSKKR
jgi:hypothetical protein